MNKIFKLFAFVLAVSGLASCEEKDNNPIQDASAERTVVYTVGDQEKHRTVNGDSEWDALLETFCDYALSGEQVVFYSLGNHSAAESKESPSISTTDRNELKRWMKVMEKEGKTVSVSYDDRTGTWNGVAYLTIPIAGEDYNCYTGELTCIEMPVGDYGMVTTVLVPALQINDDTLLVLEKYGYTMLCGSNYESGDTMTLCGTIETRRLDDSTEYLVLNLTSIGESAIANEWEMTFIESSHDSTQNIVQNIGDIYNFSDDGTVTRANGGSTVSGTWTIDADGILCCSLLPGGGCWNINWVSPQTMIISQIGNTYYTVIEFERHIN